jgi:hypothetical protein
VSDYETAARRFRSYLKQHHYWVPYYTAWNEPNYSGQPTKCCKSTTGATAAGHFYNAVYALCNDPAETKHCTVLAGDFSDAPSLLTDNYVKAYRAALNDNPKIWAWHAYSDTNQNVHTRFDAFLRMARPSSKIWITEANGIVHNGPADKLVINQTPDQADGHLQYLLDTLVNTPQIDGLAARVTRLYVFSWYGGAPLGSWDSGLVDGQLRKRAMYCTLQKRTNPTVGATCTPDPGAN